MSRNRRLPGGHKPLHTIQAVPYALDAQADACRELAREIGHILDDRARCPEVEPWNLLGRAFERLERMAESHRSMAARVRVALDAMAPEPRP